jgi:acyl-CoA hydrolase
MEGKPVSASVCISTRLMTPQDANVAGNVHGGVIMKLIDEIGGISAHRHTRTNIVTASVDRIDFFHPVYIGDIVTFKSSINMVGTSSMEVGVYVESEQMITGEIRHTTSAFLTYVALDESGHPTDVPPLILETDEDRRRNREAMTRREARLRERRPKP